MGAERDSEVRAKGAGAIARAATGMINLSVAGAAAVGAAALQSWPLLAVGGATYAALVAWDFVRGAEKKKRAAEEPVAADLEDVTDYEDAATQTAVRAIVSAKREIDRVLAETPDDVKGNLAMALISVDALMDRSAHLAARSEDLSRYLATKDPRVVKNDAETLRTRAAQASDPEAKAQYQSALASREEHLRSLADLSNARERALASLLSIASSLEGLPAKIVHMRALDADAMDQLGGDVNEELGRVNDEMKAVEETLKTLGEP